MRESLVRVTIHDCEVQTFRSGGKGGQNQNKVNSGVRVIHHPSGARGESREYREQLRNKQSAFLRMTETSQFKTWLRIETAKAMGLYAEIEREVEKQMDNIYIEYLNEKGSWTEWE